MLPQEVGPAWWKLRLAILDITSAGFSQASIRLAEQNDEWTVARRYLSRESLAPLTAPQVVLPALVGDDRNDEAGLMTPVATVGSDSRSDGGPAAPTATAASCPTAAAPAPTPAGSRAAPPPPAHR